MPKVLAIDYGLERTGLAVSDPDGKIAFPLATLSLRESGSRAGLIDRLTELARENGAAALVYGMPEFLDGSENLMCRRVRNFADRVSRRLPLPFFFESEILSTEAAKELLMESDAKKARAKKNVDEAAACVILLQFLDKLRKNPDIFP